VSIDPSATVAATNGERSYRRAFVWLPLLLGLVSLALGQDDNWDLRNYHLYNAYAWLHGRSQTDLAPAGLQSYFNPLLDVFQANLFRWLPAPLMGFLFGWLQGLNAIALILIGRRLLPVGSPPWRVIGLAVAGCMAAGFLSELGNTMGDNLTALFVLGGLLLAMDSSCPLARRKLLAAGALMGLATGLKLTNAVYAVGLAGAFLLVPAIRGRRVMPLILLGIGGLAGLLFTAGYWFWHLWQLFGNPLFPQFGSLLPNPLAANVGVADVRTLPQHLWEWLLWPLAFTVNPYRLGQKVVYQVAWPVLYLLYLAWAASTASRRWRSVTANPMDWRARRLAAFVAVSFFVWTAVFSIYRYLVPIELLAPLLCWLLLQSLLPAQWSLRTGTWVVAVVAAVGLFNLWNGWGHAPWAERAFRVQQPVSPTAAGTSVLLVGNEPMAWRIPFLSPQWAFVGVGTNFPTGPGYAPRVQTILRQRGGPVRVMLPAATYPRTDYIAKLNRVARLLGLSRGSGSCVRLDWLHRHLHLRAQVEVDARGNGCRFELREQDRIDLPAVDQATEQNALETLTPYHLHFNVADCHRYQSWIGHASRPYLWCSAMPIR
jgi:Protein of unknown function (DUF2029).